MFKNLFKKSSKQKDPNGDGPHEPTYFEVWGEAVENVQFLKKVVLILGFTCLLLLVYLKRTITRPPLVIRVNEVGRAEPVKNVNAEHRITKPEVLNFVHLFMKNFLERDMYTWDENLKEAGAMMTESFRDRMNTETDFGAEKKRLADGQLTSDLEFSDVRVTRETEIHILVALKGWRGETSRQDPGFRREVIFEAELALKRTPRTMETPYGLLVDSYTEAFFKNE